MSWFEDVTGTTNQERQAWRDSYNGGYAVGAGADYYNALNGLTGGGGGSFGGGKSGVDSQQKGGGNQTNQPINTVKTTQATGNGGRGGGFVAPNATNQTNENWSPTNIAPNQAGGPITTGNPLPGQQGGTGGGTRPVSDKVKLKPKDNDEFTQIIIGGNKVVHDTGWSDGGDMEDRWGEWGGGIGGLGVMVADGVTHLNSFLADNWNGNQTPVTRGSAGLSWSNMTAPDWDFDSDMRWLNEDRAGSYGGGF